MGVNLLTEAAALFDRAKDLWEKGKRKHRRDCREYRTDDIITALMYRGSSRGRNSPPRTVQQRRHDETNQRDRQLLRTRRWSADSHGLRARAHAHLQSTLGLSTAHPHPR
jgi:hypothetical protein